MLIEAHIQTTPICLNVADNLHELIEIYGFDDVGIGPLLIGDLDIAVFGRS